MALRSFDYLSLFSGYGGLDLSVRLAMPATRCVGYVEGEAFAASVLAARMEAGALDAAPVWSDVRSFSGDLYRGRVRMVVGGFPCQDLSVAGKQLGIVEGYRSSLFFDLLRTADDVGCEYVFMENVAGIFVRPNLDVVLGELASRGFDAEWLSLRAADVGAPHQRERWFCLARRGVGLADTGSEQFRQAADGEQSADINRSCSTDVAYRDSGRRRQRDTAERRVHEPAAGRVRLADASGLGHGTDGAIRPESDSGRPSGGPRDGGKSLVDAENSGSGAQWPGHCAPCGTNGPHGTGEHLADAEGTRLEERRWRIGAETPFAGPEYADSAVVADATDDCPRGAWAGPERGTAVRRTSASLPLFPPGPADRERWAAILRDHSDLAPAVEFPLRRVADGASDRLDESRFTYRTDRLRALGNGVVPLQGAVAFRELWRRLHGG